MSQYAYEVLEEKYNKLNRLHKDLFAFQTLNQWLAEFEGKKITPGNGEWRVTRIDETGKFEPGNVSLVKIEEFHELAKCSYPTI